MPPRAAADPAAILRELTDAERGQLAADCALVRLEPDAWPFVPATYELALFRAAGRIVRRLEVGGAKPVAAYREAGSRLRVPWRTVQSLFARQAERAVHARAQAACGFKINPVMVRAGETPQR